VGLEHVPEVIQNYHICVVKNRRIDLDVIAKATQMKIIMQYGVGLEGDYKYGIILINISAWLPCLMFKFMISIRC